MFYSDAKKQYKRIRPNKPELTAEQMAQLIGLAVLRARKVRALTQGQLAKKIGSRQATISDIETGIKLASLSTLVKIANALDMEVIIPELKFKSVPNNQVRYINVTSHSASNSKEVKGKGESSPPFYKIPASLDEIAQTTKTERIT